MLCYRCGNKLGSGRYCLHCGADVTQYRRIVRLSNRFYNHGLEKAQVRNLSGAVEDLSRALEIDKRNITARNLLGLVYYEMGETVQALCEWVVSTHYQPENNPASEYVKQLQEDRTELENANQGIRKFNFGLDYARKGSEDLAIIQLEWVTAHHPKMIKAHSLLALLYYSEGRYAKAEKEIRTVLKADVGNVFCLNMQKEMAADIRAPQVKRTETLSDNVRTSGKLLREETEKVRTALEGRPAFLLRILLTAAILLCVTVGILIPTVERRRSRAVSDAVARYSEELETVRTSLTVSEELKAAYGVFLEMYRLDPAEPEQLEQIHGLYKGLKEDLSEDTLYRALYEAWGALLPQLDAEAASRAATTEPETTPEETEEIPPETDENGNPVPPAEGGGEQPQQ
jgi:Tfp pilus assembly protein PilF